MRIPHSKAVVALGLAVAMPALLLALQTQAPSGKPSTEQKTTKTMTDHLEIATSITDAALEPGAKVTLAVDVTPHERIHVYAPGNDNYIPVSLQIDSQPALTIPPPEFPPAEDFYFAPLNEHVKVYQKSFRIVQHVTLAATDEFRESLKKQPSLTIKGTVRYQACDDRVCFAPTRVPVSWTINAKAGGPAAGQ
jgi:thiol:disulfide interchange protein DsbD